ncbi:MAG: RimK family alpha-L-glutamate ligase, partial [Clostridia bacterium]|nr:RimK family alpha-L-glutamate ligase [Clostridia bacterium]
LAGVVPAPKTLASPLQFKSTEDQYITEIEKVVDYPMVVKEVFGSLGANVHLAENREQLKSIRSALLLKPHIYQEFIGAGGSDLRLIVIGGKVVACMRRVNENDFRSNVELGGRGEKVTPTKIQIEYAERAAKAIKLDYCGIDILSDQTGDYVCEVNSNAFWRAVSEVSGVNVAKAYAKYLFDRFFN